MNINYKLIWLAPLFCLMSCYDLNKTPEGVISSANAFSSIGEIESYLDQFYETAGMQQGFEWSQNYIASGDLNSDNLSGASVNTRLNGALTLSNAVKLNNYKYIRNINFLLTNLGNCNDNRSAEYKQCIGEAYFFRAWYYFQLFKNYGELTWIDKPLDPNIEVMQLPREHRTIIADHIRNINFLLTNLGNCNDNRSAEYKQCIGEAYFFRAWYYFQLFKNYGELTWIDKPLDPNIEVMQLPREHRTIIADHILKDLDKAIANLQEQNNSSTMRIHRDVARTLKSEVALFEATWEKYHKLKNDAFYDKTITDEKILQYFTICTDACKDVINRGIWHIYTTGDKLNDYRKLFQIEDLSNNPEVFWFRHYDGTNIGNNVNRYLNRGGGSIGVTASLVDDYLTIDGKPFVGEQVIKTKKIYGNELKPTLRDPRLSQTVCTPGQKLRPDAPAYIVPPLIGSSYHKNETGYSLLKHVQINYKGNLDAEFRGATPGIQYRYADVLLNYAEALAELDGPKYASKIIQILQPLRNRVGMPAVNFDREYNTLASYPFHALNKYIQCVRRERRIEQAAEGKRLTDILRWAAADELIVGKHAEGALFTGSNLEHHPQYQNKLVYDKDKGSNLFLSGKHQDTYRYILPINPKTMPNGWQFDTHRDYLLPIQPRMLILTNNKWKQNPGWE